MSQTLPQFHKPTFDRSKMYVLVWGGSGCGKTTLASTAPDGKAYIQFDAQGHTSIANRDDIALLDLSGCTFRTAMMEFNKADPFGMKAFILANPYIETIVIDSITTLAFLALQHAVTIAGGKSSIDVPGQNGYGVRNNVMRRVVQSIMQIASETNKHLVIITHDKEGEQDDNGRILEITMSLSSALANDVALRFNEVWFMKDTGTERRIYVRAFGVFKPMKTRMFMTDQGSHFVWHYNADTLTGDGIASWFNQWKENEGKKIPMPKK